MSRRAYDDDDDDGESAAATVMKVAVAVAEAAAVGARHRLVTASEEAPQGGGAGAGALLVGGNLSVQQAADAAAEGAADSVEAMLPSLPASQLRLVEPPPLRRHIKKDAALGASAGVRAAAILFSIQTPAAPAAPSGDVEDPEAPPEIRVLYLGTVADSAAAAAWRSAFDSVSRALAPCPPPPPASWANRLGPILGGSVAAVATLCPHLASAEPWQTITVLGAAGLAFLTLMVGVAAVPPMWTSMRPDDVSRRAGFLSFIIIKSLFVGVLCYMLRRDPRFAVPPGVVGGLAILFIAYLWYRSERRM
ncbi:hypothetical protein U9M48_011834 [Paspalum notatum var. saurae]|uniref:Uncharacterized protein n=1 Tax=Paspalum notatum var. saurae TaxID=547442 RepID=A0AAQ3SWK6_PASNO